MIIIIPLFIVVVLLMWSLRPGKSAATARKVAILLTAIPPVLLAISAIVFQLLHNAAGKTWVSDIANSLVIIISFIIAGEILASVGFALMRKKEIAKGIGFGTCIAVIIFIIVFGLLEWLAGV